MTVAIKRVYEQPSPKDGARVLVDRLWPRGLSKQSAALHTWLKELAPSNELRQWYHAHPQEWSKFRERYFKELSTEKAGQALQELYQIRNTHPRLTLLFASRNQERNNALVLKQLLEGHRKPPNTTGPIRAGAVKRARAAAVRR